MANPAKGLKLAGAADFDASQIEAGENLFRRPWLFVKSCPALEHLPPADRSEIGFAGRSNVGKSSLLNAIVGVGGLARTSNTPGRTQELNYFTTPDIAVYLVDMPGYGFAKAPKAKVEAWTAVVKDYLRGRPNLKRVFLLIDSRHGIKPNDTEILEMLDSAGVPYQVVLTKIDKLKEQEVEGVVTRTEAALKTHPAALPVVLPTSSEKRTGIPELRASMARLVAENR